MRGRTLRLSYAVLEAAMAAALAVTLVGCAGSTGSDNAAGGAGSNKPIKVGAVVSLTGTYAGLGAPEKKTIEMEVKRVNEAGGINGRPLEVIIEDDGTDEAKAVAAASRLIDQEGVVALIGASGTGQTMAMRSDLQRAGVAQVSMAGGTVITGQFDPLVFQTPWSNTIVVPGVLDAIKAAGHTKIALLSDTGGYGKDGHAVILAEAKKSGLAIVSDQTFNPGDTDLSAQLTRIKGAGAQAVLLWTAGKEGALAVKNARDLGVNLPFYGGSGQARQEFISGSDGSAEGFIFVTGKSLIAQNWPADSEEFKVVSDFAKRYEAEYGEKPDIFAGHAFDAVNIVVDALKRANSDDPSKIRDAIEQTSGLPGFGGPFTFSSTDHNGLTTDDLSLYEVTNDSWVTVK